MGKSERIDLVGQRFERLVVVGEPEKRGRKLYWPCRCDCGAEKHVHGDHLKAGRSRSCGCLNAEMAAALMTKHGGAAQVKAQRHPLYSTWCGMKKRCDNPKWHGYAYYGGRGITVSRRWRDDFAAFVADMGPKPSPAHTIDRRDVDGDYEPDNCRWATPVEQRGNRQRLGGQDGRAPH